MFLWLNPQKNLSYLSIDFGIKHVKETIFQSTYILRKVLSKSKSVFTGSGYLVKGYTGNWVPYLIIDLFDSLLNIDLKVRYIN